MRKPAAVLPLPFRAAAADRTARAQSSRAAPVGIFAFLPRIASGLGLVFAVLALTSIVRAATFTAEATWNDNATNADRAADRLGALRLETSAVWQCQRALARNLALLIGGRIEAEAWPRFDGLDRVAVGPSLELRRKFGLGPLAPTLSLVGETSFSAARESGRTGPAGALSLIYRQRFTPQTQWQLAAEASRHDARATVFDRDGFELSSRIAHDFSDTWRAALSVRWRTGTVLAYATPPRPDLVALERTRALSTTFARPLMAYAIDAETLAVVGAVSRALGETTSLNLTAEWRDTTRHSHRYRNRLVSLGVAHQF